MAGVSKDGRPGPVSLEPVGAQEDISGSRTWEGLVWDLMGQRQASGLVERLAYLLLAGITGRARKKGGSVPGAGVNPGLGNPNPANP